MIKHLQSGDPSMAFQGSTWQAMPHFSEIDVQAAYSVTLLPFLMELGTIKWAFLLCHRRM